MSTLQWLNDLFEYENCHECGQGADFHVITSDPFGHPHATCQPREEVHLFIVRVVDDDGDVCFNGPFYGEEFAREWADGLNPGYVGYVEQLIHPGGAPATLDNLMNEEVEL